MRRALVAAVVVLAAASPAGAAAAPQRTTLGDVEDEVMCVVCGVPLNIAESPEADQERRIIRGAIARGDTKAQVKRVLVAEYGPQVLATPQGGLSGAAWLVPAALIAALAAALAVLVPRWRRSAPSPPADGAPAPLDPIDARRLEEDMARHAT